ncbi:Acg family FMN-binding oxidoreductase [Virgisporangium ochraceum]|uniref:NAD(P)H nitroreductase n=1 Tax=Virgisporangium ochraceum TaxID=65505 RepID=A0A8J3ZVU7_9ACTN|nr:nitroreductase [Virgisporangium ochraceum]GIJ71072.1 NAD(P)H nitroreductase [Virgisporangium ochraceum]
MSDVTRALTGAVTVAGRAPSIHNTQPWRFVVDGDRLDLHTEPSRQLRELDPEGHMMLVSCGAALHHAVVALAAEGWHAEVERTGAPEGAVASVRVTGPGEPDPHAVRRVAAVPRRHTDRRPVAPVPVPPDALAAVTDAVTGTGLRIHVLQPKQVVELAVAVDRALRAEGSDDRQRAELAGWVGGAREAGTGVPDAAIPRSAPETTVPGRDFGVDGTLTVPTGHDERAVHAVIYGTGDRPVDWLRAGEALSAAWLDAVDNGLTLLPESSPAEIASTRLLLRQLVSHVGYPYLVVRLGVAHDETTTTGTPRLPAPEIVELR